MLAADRARVPIWDFMGRGLVWRELYRIADAAERRAGHEIAAKNARRQKLAQMKGGR